jgi:acyl-CoA dehydrogenase
MPDVLAVMRSAVTELGEAEERLAQGDFAGVETLMADVRRRNRGRGWWLPQLPRRDGGLGLDGVELTAAGEVLGTSPLGHYAVNYQAPDAGNVEILLRYGTDAQKDRWLQPLLDGRIRSCFAVTEPDRAGSNPTSLDTVATPVAGGWQLRGRKWLVSGADGAAFAVVLAITDPAAPVHARATTFIVPTDTAGYRHVRNIRIMGDAGGGWASHGELAFDDCRLPPEAVLGARGEGFVAIQARLAAGRLHHCARWVGVCERAFAMMCRRALEREISPGEMLSSRQTVQNWVAECRASIDASRLLVHQAATRLQDDTESANADISMAKFFVAGVVQRVLDCALQVHGGLGASGDTILNTFWRHERAGRIYDGPDEVHKALVARHALARFRGERS